MATLETLRRDTVDLDPEEFIRLRAENPELAAGAAIIPPDMSAGSFGKIRVRLPAPRYEVRL